MDRSRLSIPAQDPCRAGTGGHAAERARRPLGACCALLLVVTASGRPQEPAFSVRRADAPLVDLLAADHPSWANASAVRWGPAPYPTELRALHTEDGLALRFAATDDAPWHTLTERDDPIWNEEVVEIFIDPDGDGRNYAEIEISPANVVCDLQILAAEPTFASDIGWDFAGLATRVAPLRGAADEVTGWIATAILPWAGFAALRDTEVPLPPVAGDHWRFNAFRIKRPGGPAAPDRDVVYAPWSPTPSLSFHAPAAFRALVFEHD